MNARAELPFDVCLRDALRLSGGWMTRWVAQLGAALSEREAADASPYGRRGQAQARAVLSGCGDRLVERWSRAFSAAVHADVARLGDAPAPGGRRPARSLSMDELELMDHRQVQSSVELARLQQVVKGAVDEELIELTALMSAAQGLRTVRPEANPLRPEVVIDALQTALGDLNVDDAVRLRWLHAGAPALGQALRGFYAALVQTLEAQGVEPAGFVVVPVVTPRAAAPVRADSAVATTAAGDGAALVLTLDHLHQLLVGNLAHSGTAVSDQGTSGSGNAMVRTLATEVVSLMLRTIAEDVRLLAPVREMVMQLKPALLHLAKTEPRFFADRDNPARRLLDAITARSLAFSSEQDTGFQAFALELHLTVQSLQTPSPGLADRVAQRLAQMESLGRPDDGDARRTLVRVEQRHLLAGTVAEEIRARPDFARAPALVRRVLLGPWAQVVAHARLHVDGLGEAPMLVALAPAADEPALRYMAVLSDLLWSCQLAQASLNRPRLIRVVPAVLRTVREGLDTIDFPREQAQPFFQTLMGLHEAAYKTQRSGEFLAATTPRRPADPPAEPWFQGQEARASGFIDTQLLEPAFVDTEPMDTPSDAGDQLSVGAWVELRQAGVAQRCQLRWVSPHRSMFLFATPEGRPVSLTRRGLERLSTAGRLQVVAEKGVVDEALAAVAKLAWLNSGKLA